MHVIEDCDRLQPLLRGRIKMLIQLTIYDDKAKTWKVAITSKNCLRRCFILTGSQAEANVFSIQELMGHADLQVLKRYVKLTAVLHTAILSQTL